MRRKHPGGKSDGAGPNCPKGRIKVVQTWPHGRSVPGWSLSTWRKWGSKHALVLKHDRAHVRPVRRDINHHFHSDQRAEGVAAMSTQGDSGMEISVLREDKQEYFQLLELPAELLEIITSQNSPM